jgi:hypothetical protein
LGFDPRAALRVDRLRGQAARPGQLDEGAAGARIRRAVAYEWIGTTIERGCTRRFGQWKV